MEEPEPPESTVLIADRRDQPRRIPLAHGEGDAEDLAGVRIADEMRVEGLAVTGDAGDGVEVRLEKVRAGAHLREHHEMSKGMDPLRYLTR